MLIYSSSEAEDSNDHNAPTTKLFGRERSVHSLLGGGQGISKKTCYFNNVLSFFFLNIR